MQSAKFAVMYDAEAIYLSAVVRDPSPMLNRHDPNVTGDTGWDADACQFRMTLDPSKPYPLPNTYGQSNNDRSIVHLTLWNYTDRNEPCLQMSNTMSYKVPRSEWGKFGVVPHDLY